MKSKLVLFCSILLMLIFYSSEISFMPNFTYRPDKWHLLPLMFGFSILIFVQLIWNIVVMIKKRKVSWDILLLISLSILTFLFLNNPKGNSENIGYLSLMILAVISIVLYGIEYKRMN